MKKFEFDKEKHAYKLDGKRMTGCTTIISILDKPALVQWSANMAVDYIKDNHRADFEVRKDKEVNGDYLVVSKDTLEEARKAWRIKRDKAGDIGTAVHDMIEMYVKAQINGNRFQAKHQDERVQKMFDKFVEWEKEENIKFLLSEQKLYSEKHWFAGTVDLIFEKDGKRFIGDIKTAKDIYQTNYIQMGGYDIMLEELGKLKDCAGYCVINIPKQFKKDGSAKIKVKYLYNPEDHKEAFLNCLNLYRYINKK